MTLILGHRGYKTKHLENSMESFRAALAAGMDGFELDAQPTLDGVSMILHDDTVDRTALGSGTLRRMKSSEVPKLRNGEPLPKLAEALALPAKLINVELKGEPGWKQALATVEAAEALGKVLFSSFEHSEVLQLWAACPEARCGFLWEHDEAMDLNEDDLAELPPELHFHPPLSAVQAKPGLWKPYASRLALWGMATPKEAASLGFEPGILIADGPEAP